ncbi:MAG: suppressor of glycerol defect [Peltula sp. TS41687]|nr:MAG: suppressor of glycerol defect [Peltula sp. TS41687]
MVRRPPHNTTKLPRQLADELAIDNDVHAHRGGAGKRTTTTTTTTKHRTFNGSWSGSGSRKERRRAERVQKKVRRHTQQSSHSSNGGRKPSRLDAGDADVLSQKRAPPEPIKQAVAPPLKSILKKSSEPVQSHADTNKGSPGLRPSMSKGVRERIARDDADIAALERKLGIKKKKRKGEMKPDDDGDEDGDGDGDGDGGLGDLLNELDGEDGEDYKAGAKRKRTEEHEWLLRKRMKAQGIVEQDRSQGSEVEGEDEDEDESDDMLSTASDSLESGDDGVDDEEHSIISGSSEDIIAPPQTTKTRENPYLPPTTTVASKDMPAKYIPPSLRNASSSENDSLVRLRRQTQGILNRLSESNLVSILGDIERIYANHPRQHVTSTLVELLIGVVCDRASLLDTFLILHAGLAAAIYKVIGVDFGASLVDRVVAEFDRAYMTDGKAFDGSQTSGGGGGGGGKKTLNVISLLAELYNLQVVGSHLIFDFVRLFLSEVSEINTELLLRVVRSSGPQLRQDDPSALKDVVLLLQRAIATLGEATLSVRTRFMLETINDLKNNKLKTGVGPSSLRSQSLVNMKKSLGSLNTRKLQATEPLRISLHDIRHADKRGKWWLVGASWRSKADGGGNNHDDEEVVSRETGGGVEEGKDKNPPTATTTTTTTERDDFNLDPDLMQLAREQQMNTDVRRAIFIAIMSAADYQDAYVRLTKLRLKRAQELEIPRVVMHCARAEQVYNPYYTLLARRLCGDRKLKMAFQFSLWGLFKAMGERGDEDAADADLDDEEGEGEGEGEGAGGGGGVMAMRKIVNVAKLFGSLIVDGALELTILKVLNFAYLQTKTRTFVELLLITIILLSQRQAGISSHKQRDEKSLVDMFVKVGDHPSLARGLQFFLKTVVSKTDVAGGKAEKETVRWGCKVAGNVLTSIVASVVVTEG